MKYIAAIVFEDEIIRELLKHYFQKNGFEVQTFESGLDLLNHIKTERVSIVLTDLVLPDLTGIDLYDRLRDPGLSESVPVFFLSARNISSELSRRMKNDGLIQYFQKPIDPVEVITHAWRVIRK